MTDETVLDEFLDPLRRATESAYARRELFGTAGWDVGSLPEARVIEALETVDDAATRLMGFVDDPPESLSEFTEALGAAGELADGFLALEDAVSDTTGVPPEVYTALGEDLFTQLVVAYLDSNHPVLLQVAVVLTLLRPGDAATRPTLTLDDGTVVRYSSPAPAFDLDHVVDLLTDPVETLVTEYGLDDPSDEEGLQTELARQLFPLVAALLHATGGRVSYSTENVEFFDPHDDLADLGDELGWLRIAYDLGTENVDVRAHVYAEGSDVTLVVVPGGNASVSQRFGRWAVTLSVDATADEVAIDTDGDDVQFPGSTGRVGVSLSAVRLPSTDDGDSFVLGGTEGTRLEVGRLGVEGHAEIDRDQEYGIVARASDSTFVLDTTDGDGFLSEVFPAGFGADFDLGLGWSTERGVHLDGSRTLERNLPMHLSLGEALSFDDLSVGVSPDVETARIPVYVAATATAELGPVTATVERLGLEAEVSFPEEGGNLGLLNVDLGFRPPAGVGLSVDASAVVGGGYLHFDPERERYAGSLTLKIGTLTLDAVGLLTTRLPDGRDGFSLLVIITGEFPPVRLGFGFTLNAVGGLLGVNRSTRVEPLRAGVRDDSIRSVLFPEDPIRNAPTLVSDLRRFFPPTRGQHVFGPMAELGWGTPTIVRAQLGLLLELPSPVRLLVLGRIRAALPAEEETLLLLQMNALGVIDFDEGTAAVDASLYDSRVVTYPLTGDMAMRANWGDDPAFALSVGGFHPGFDPPPGFPRTRPVTVALASGENPRLRLAGYFALTSNTAQVGATVDAHAAAGGFSVDGHLGFDALFQFDPFAFVVDVAAHVAVRGHGLSLGLGLEGSLRGPSPWRLRGKAYIDLFLFSATVRVDATIGDPAPSPRIPPAEVFEEFRAALGRPDNWSAQLPEGGDSLVTLRDIEPGETEVLAHPLGELGVLQRVVPMNVAIDRYGNAEPADFHTFRIGSVTVDGQANEDLVGTEREAEFAPAQFFDLTDGEKLSGSSFRRFPAGYRVTNGLFAYGGQPSSEDGPLGPEVATQTLSYESSYVDEETDSTGPLFPSIAPATVAALSEVSAVATGDAWTTGPGKFRPEETLSVSVTDPRYTVVTTDTLEPVHETGVPVWTTYAQAKQARDAHVADGPDAGVQVVAAHELTDPSGGEP